MYAPLLCGLAHRGEVLRIGTVFASTFLRAVKFLEGHGRAICIDISGGPRTPSLSIQKFKMQNKMTVLY